MAIYIDLNMIVYITKFIASYLILNLIFLCLGPDFKSKTVDIDGKKIVLEIWYVYVQLYTYVLKNIYTIV